MPQVNLTAKQIEDAMGAPITLLSAFDQTTGTFMALNAEDLPPAGIAYLVAWVNARLSTP